MRAFCTSRRSKKKRKEILQAEMRRLQNGEHSSTEYNVMLFLNATIKEVLRLHPIAHTLMRRAVQDDCLPLSEPIITKDGKALKDIPIPKG
ncbi:hypothetical protein DFS33DRAFT_250589 [Desarmillaria ectypa]|nr:hypothetical protein DFS33DRAFT_250589 [Desarmillaria ectypa]